MTKEKFLNIEIEEPPVELQLSVEMRVREILKSDDDIEKNHKNEYDRMFNYFKTLKKRNSNN